MDSQIEYKFATFVYKFYDRGSHFPWIFISESEKTRARRGHDTRWIPNVLGYKKELFEIDVEYASQNQGSFY